MLSQTQYFLLGCCIGYGLAMIASTRLNLGGCLRPMAGMVLVILGILPLIRFWKTFTQQRTILLPYLGGLIVAFLIGGICLWLFRRMDDTS